MEASKILKAVGNYVSFLLNYLLAGASLVAALVLLLFLGQIISQSRASYPALRPITGSSLAKPIFLRSTPIYTPDSFEGTALSVSPNGEYIAYWGSSADSDGQGLFTARVNAAMANGEDDRLIWRFVAWHVWSPDSTRLLLEARQEELGAVGIAVASADGSTFKWIVLPPDWSIPNQFFPVTAATWSPDGKAVIFVQSKASDTTNELWRVTLEDGQRQRLAALPKEPDKPNIYIRSLSLSPDGKKVVFINADRPEPEKSSTWWIMNLDGSLPLSLMKRGQDASFVRRWQWSPDSRRLLFDVSLAGAGGYLPATLWLMNADGTARRQLSTSEHIDGFSLSPKGDWAIYGKESHLWLANIETSQEEQLSFGDDSEGRPMWLASGDVLYHLTVGSVTSLRLLEHAEAADIPGLATPIPAKSP